MLLTSWTQTPAAGAHRRYRVSDTNSHTQHKAWLLTVCITCKRYSYANVATYMSGNVQHCYGATKQGSAVEQYSILVQQGARTSPASGDIVCTEWPVIQHNSGLYTSPNRTSDRAPSVKTAVAAAQVSCSCPTGRHLQMWAHAACVFLFASANVLQRKCGCRHRTKLRCRYIPGVEISSFFAATSPGHLVIWHRCQQSTLLRTLAGWLSTFQSSGTNGLRKHARNWAVCCVQRCRNPALMHVHTPLCMKKMQSGSGCFWDCLHQPPLGTNTIGLLGNPTAQEPPMP